MTTTALITRGNLVMLPGAARSVVAPRRHRSFWRRPWWWPVRYCADALRSLQRRVEQMEAALQVAGVRLAPGGAL